MNACLLFRSRLEAALIGELHGAPVLWHDHLVGCSACRELFEAEEALDHLLACLPEPELPLALAKRVVRRLQREQHATSKLDDALDAALAGNDVPAGLADRVLAGLAGERSAPAGSELSGVTLDDLLGQVPAPEIPSGLSARVLANLEPVEVAASTSPFAGASPRPLPFFRFGLAAAASVLAMFVGYRLWQPAPELPNGTPMVAENTPEADRLAPEQPDPELLASLDLLEEWDLLVADTPADLDVVLGSLDDVETELLLLDSYVTSTGSATGNGAGGDGAASRNDEEEG